MDAESPISTQTLLEHTDWVRRLARSLVFDPDRAEDVVQETWRAALAAAPEPKRDLRAWLAVVARNAARSLGRSESRRRVREHAVARPEAQPDVVDVLEKAQLQKRVTDALLELDEPYRTTLLLRHFEERKPAEIARQLGRPVNTVRTHLERGHAQLRARLDDEFGGREAWGLALLPLARLPEGAAGSAALVPSIGGWIVMLKWSLAAAAALVGVLALTQGGGDAPPVEREEVALRAPEAPSEPLSVPGIKGTPPTSERRAVTVEGGSHGPGAGDVTSGAPRPAAIRVPVAGRVVDATGSPLAGVTLRFLDRDGPRFVDGWLRDGGTNVRMDEELREAVLEHPELLETLFQHSPDRARVLSALRGRGVASSDLTTDLDGRFEGVLPFERFDISIADEGLALLGSGEVRRADGEAETLHVVTPVAPIAGRVLDEDGGPAADVELTAEMTLEGIHGFPHVLESSSSFHRWRIEVSDVDGGFRHEGLPVVPGLILWATTRQSGSAQLLVDAQPREALELRLRVWRREDPFVVTGRVLDAQGAAAGGAQVLFSQEERATDAEGRFRIEVGYLVDDTRLIVAKPGYAPAFLDRLEARLREDPLAGRDLVLRIGEPTSEIRGRVVDQDGEPVSNARVLLEGGEPFGGVFANVEDVLGGRGNVGVDTDAEGRFVYDGLYRASYGLRVYQRSTFLAARVENVATGTNDVELVLPTRDRLPLLSGRVVDRRGEGVAGAAVLLGFTTFETPDGGRSTSSQDLGVTDERGHFAFTDVPHAQLELVVRGGGLERTTFPLDRESATDLELVVELRLRFQLDRARFGEFDRFQAVDRAGEGVVVTEYRSGVTTFRDRVRLSDDPTWPTYEVSDTATELVFFLDDTEALRVPLELDRSEVTVVR